jgi:hypothetical protein
VTGHSNWTEQKETTRLLAILQGQAVCVVHIIPTETTYEDTEKLEHHYWDHQLAADYFSQLQNKT